MTDSTLEAIGTYILIPLVGNMAVNVYKAYLQHKEAKKTKEVAVKVDEAAIKVEEVRTNLVASNAHTNDKLDQIHQLVNGEMSRQKEKTAVALRRLAQVTCDAADIQDAEKAEEAFLEHRAKLQRAEYRANPDLTPDKDKQL